MTIIKGYKRAITMFIHFHSCYRKLWHLEAAEAVDFVQGRPGCCGHQGTRSGTGRFRVSFFF